MLVSLACYLKLYSKLSLFFPINSLSSELYRLHQRGPAAGPAAGSQPGGDVVRRPLTSVSFSVLISNALSSFFLFCARRLFHRGSSLGGIVSDPFLAGGGITPWGDAVRRPQIVFAAGRRRAGRCECALLLIALDVGRHRFLFR